MDKKIDKIIQVLDQAMIEKGKKYLTLAQASKVLRNERVLSIKELNDKTLKNLLENKEIINAVKTEEKPRQWRILPSSYYIKEKIKKSEIEKKRSKREDSYTIYQNMNPNSRRNLIVALIIGVILLFSLLGKDSEESEYVETRAIMMNLKEQGLATDKDIENYDRLHRESKSKK